MDKAHELAQSIVHRYLMLHRYQRHFGHLLRKKLDISGRQLAVLRYLVQSARDGTSSRTVSQISRFLYIRDGTTSPLLERMERAGLVRRTRCREDHRKVLIDLTDRGREIVARAPMGATARMRAYLPELPVEELEAMDRALEKLAEIAQVDEFVICRKEDIS